MLILIGFIKAMLLKIFTVSFFTFLATIHAYVLISVGLPILIDFLVSFFPEISSTMASINGTIGYFLEPFHLDYAIKILLAAESARFTIRRAVVILR